jgi:hypothetical protein
MTILAFGCSVTHATEIAAPGNSESNIPFSYPKLIADYLGVDCKNFAFCGNSNENIFHQALTTIPTVNNITAVIVGWTSTEREVWQADGRIWQFIPSWCGTSIDIWQPYQSFSTQQGNNPTRCADSGEYLDILGKIYDVLIKYRFDSAVYAEKTNNYILALRSYCENNNIRLLETSWADNIDNTVNIGSIGDWYPEMKRHPNAEEHKKFARQIVNYYKL